MMTELTRYLPDAESQESLAAELAQHTPAGMVIFLYGNLGVGKTTFVRGFLRGLGYEGSVKSPTYTLVEIYHLDGRNIYHFDLYRLADPEELEYAGGRDYFDGESICLVEWPEKAVGALPTADLECRISYCSGGRELKLLAWTERGNQVIDKAFKSQ